VFKAYTTRVGAGPMPTELHDATGELIRQLAHEFGTTTGRARQSSVVPVTSKTTRSSSRRSSSAKWPP